jgi:hypothetical protein
MTVLCGQRSKDGSGLFSLFDISQLDLAFQLSRQSTPVPFPDALICSHAGYGELGREHRTVEHDGEPERDDVYFAESPRRS